MDKTCPGVNGVAGEGIMNARRQSQLKSTIVGAITGVA